jgi:hypothetical protein
MTSNRRRQENASDPAVIPWQPTSLVRQRPLAIRSSLLVDSQCHAFDRLSRDVNEVVSQVIWANDLDLGRQCQQRGHRHAAVVE